ncbi:hypothetical protein AQUCO_02600385v1 [Aquilegia coerulea]|uniref:FAR1 domain-containing protein n=1 Tax=Aquilegia coerulea TaxID=218851 RepID=A0A2G5D8Q3_AQUCA|nr:hypothetical protein AQUCO_02600385v1 [Aquilegia coerulea]PIA39894.1 hypothetical protein AQUCO_02600385v1 [Aquilegia coerulea]PIA39895.1 hypothetical protein AQUCO_02600385v1 [Aquilegia coerulea]
MENEASQFEDSSDRHIDEDTKLEDMISIDEDIEKNILEEKPRELELGMIFDSVGEVFDYYVKYGNEKGFPVKRRSSKKGDDGEVRWVIFACSRSGKTESTSKKAFKMHHLTKTGCKAKINAALMPDGKWRVTSIVLDHNHELTPGKIRSQKKNRTMGPHVKQKLEVKDQGSIMPTQNNASDEHKNERFGRMCNAFLHQVVDLAAGNEDKTRIVMQWIEQLSKELNKGDGDNQPTSLPLSQLYTSSTSDDIDSIAKESGINCSLSADHGKSRLPIKRKQSNVEQTVGKKKENNKKEKEGANGNIIREHTLEMDPIWGSIAMEFGGPQKSILLKEPTGGSKAMEFRISHIPNVGSFPHGNHPVTLTRT